ncbi:hypothetical protein TRVA0_048S00760 [Trichomonascus vanleenenianus]|uniref:uncharacterized protein n=1 Tax=Trichomonascus vanleenenianus TaxID=2268995 RepID=UPI003EC99E16
MSAAEKPGSSGHLSKVNRLRQLLHPLKALNTSADSDGEQPGSEPVEPRSSHQSLRLKAENGNSKMGRASFSLHRRKSREGKKDYSVVANRVYPTMSASAPSSRSVSQAASQEEDDSSERHHYSFFRFARSRVQTGVSGDASSGRSTPPESPMKALNPGDFLPKELQVENWSLGAKYAPGHRHIISKSKGVVGKGATAVVKTVQTISTKEVCAVKVYHRHSTTKGESQEEYYKRLGLEYVIAKRMNHRNIVSTVDLCVDSTGAWCSVMEYCDCGDVYSLLEAYRNSPAHKMGREERDCLFKQLLMGVAFMHDHGIAHRDIKPENLLMNSKGFLKISDFGVSEIVQEPGSAEIRLVNGINGSVPYLAPEVFTSSKEDKYDARKVDTWACAIVWLNMALNGHLFAAAKESDPGYSQFVERFNLYRQGTESLNRYLESEAQIESPSQSEGTNSPAYSSMILGGDNKPVSRVPSRAPSGKATPSTLSPRLTPQEGSEDVPDDTYENGAVTRDNVMGYVEYINRPFEALSMFFTDSAKALVISMLNPDPDERPLVHQIVRTPFVKRIGMCIGPDPCELTISQPSSNIDVTNVSSIRRIKSTFIQKNHSHKPPQREKKFLVDRR